jgi:general stress protein CsbA
VFFLKAALIIPLGLAIFWKRMTSTAFVASLVLAIAIGYPVRETVGELQGIITLEAISLVAAVGISLLSRQTFDFATLRDRGDALSAARPAAAVVPAADPDPVR